MFTPYIDTIIIKDRIRKNMSRTFELAEDIMKNGLLNPITVMSLDDGTYQLLAGLRRIKAAKALGWEQISANVVSPADAEAALRMEISENEQREPFTFSEQMDFGRLFEDIEKAKAKERQTEGQSLGGKVAGRGRPKDDNDSLVDCGPPSYDGAMSKTRDVIGAKIGMSGRQYDRAKYVAENASPEVIDELDRGERTVRRTYDELRSKSKPPTPSDEKTVRVVLDEPAEIVSEPGIDALKGKIKALENELYAERARTATAESELALLKNTTGISIDHKTSIIEALKQHNAQLIQALEEANLKNARLEARILGLEDAGHETGR